ncbi:hypothetical protein A3H10_02075 [Candidatus Uhrbacteria bacterium RIFCSPLOWO2_12_FULL_46_10]|uniref:Four helix bundle protein n=1 Tax=Candidatus Uhrbacteria bacterium RIFCSPLOWO2_01_FULL_47_25 TaxID=1802402 RepID=A0A1F7UXH4_9BACT|nr:MAG: hypothetical protein A2752_04230 [Candidatus Uhrbacteria bacterium RIFCSPHIGHO2_01_FULL_46_23]OGL70303.1 MAG: hypothetical protein A3D60_01745 [Candidatus Uhrbacteria bacterium RIFCSPHIGHO2_02_FULL_47_29]OGL75089.1 MAG: hypothetical protein A3E96_01775 [Candidatus Uhrbacteria bacterium RIFCSPHIGHO2_12_FULL_46_13]OGL82990.1 MAG: hypothetical protein A2936_03490 [Candidatus Uhrbacteria bacterium RIFCSPLOWO2_01_FULL_47_25]OGL84436.1 MAG: hypothetical protein A3I37_03480 [Candidatus Uhrbact
MKSEIKSFRDLVVWQKASALATLLYKVTENFPKTEIYGITSQMRRAAVSVSSNIAEGFKRNSKKEKVQFYSMAYGSLSELESQIEISFRLEYLTITNYDQILSAINEVSRLLDGIIRSTNRNYQSRFDVLVAVSIFYILYSIFPISPANAGEIGLAVTRNRFDIEMLSGDTYKGDLAVYNKSADAALPVHVELALWNIKEDSEDIEFVQAESLLNATRWFEVQPKDFILDQGGDRQIKFEITAPKDASPGAYLVMMRFQAVLPEHYFLKEGPRFLPEIGVLFFINVRTLAIDSAAENNRLNIVSFEPEGTHRLTFIDRYVVSPANAGVFDEAVKKLVAKIENKSIYYFKASGFVVIKNLFGQTVSLIKIPEKFLLPNRTRSIPITVITPPTEQSKSNILYSIFYILQQQTYLGPYTATLTLNVPSSNGGVEPISESINFWIIPWKFWSAVIIIALLIAFIILKLRRRLRPALSALIGR